MKQANHPRIGVCEILVEAEIDTKTGKKNFTLIRAKRNHQPTKRNGSGSYQNSTSDHHYILWGNTPDFDLMGVTQCMTKSLRASKGIGPIRRFFEIIKTAEYVKFKK